MDNKLSFNTFIKRFPNEETCLEEIVNMRFPSGIVCKSCQRVTKHYKLKNHPIYSCKFCRTQVSPLTDTLFEKSSTPLSVWFYALFLMTQTRAEISARTLAAELDVTYKTAWRMYKNIYKLMQQNKGDLLTDKFINRWVIFNKIELKVVTKT